MIGYENTGHSLREGKLEDGEGGVIVGGCFDFEDGSGGGKKGIVLKWNVPLNMLIS